MRRQVGKGDPSGHRPPFGETMASSSDDSLAFCDDLEVALRRDGMRTAKVRHLLRELLIPTLHTPGEAARAYEAGYEAMLPGLKAFTFWKGRVALFSILRGMGIGQGDEVMMPGYTCVVVPGATIYAGAKPVYVDIRASDYNIDPDLLDQAVTPRTKALIVQHTYGVPAQLDRITDWASARDLPIIEDCCHALGCTHRGGLLGTFGKAAFFSSQWNKHYPTALGGVAVVNDADLAGRVGKLRDEECRSPSRRSTWMIAAQILAHHLLVFPSTLLIAQSIFRWLTAKGLVIGSATGEELTNQCPAHYLTAMSDLQARIGLFELARLRRNLSHRHGLAKFYRDQLGNLPADWPDQPLVRYPLRVEDRDAFLAAAFRERIEVGTWFECPLHPKETDHALFDYEFGCCPEAERAAGQVVNLPVHMRVSRKYAERVVDFARRYAGQVT